MRDLKMHIDPSLEPLCVKCDSQQIPSNHGETEDGKQHSFRKWGWEALATERRLFIQG